MTNTPTGAAEPALRDFGIDTTSQATGEALRDYLGKIRRGDLGALPALVTLAALLVLFTALSDDFLTLNNLANLLHQGAGQTIIAMGIVYVLLIGEIDLSAGTASGVSASVLALHFQNDGNLLGAMGGSVYFAFVLGLAVAALLAMLLRIWLGAALSALAMVLVLAGVGANPWLEMLLAVCVGAAIGCVTGFAVSKVRIPSFIVTLGLFITWSGVVLQLVGPGGTISIRQSPELFAVANGSLSVTGSWLLFLIAGAGYAAVVGYRHLTRLRYGLVAQPTVLVATKVVAVLGCGGLATYLLTLNRSPHPELASIRGVPLVVPIILALLIIGTFVLDRTRYGRHVHAVGNNRDAAHRAGVNVAKIRMSAFIISSSVAALGAIVYSSKVGLVDGSAGNGNLVLFAVGAAVIGGTSLFGGKGRLHDAILGGAVLATVQNGLNLLGFQAAPVNIITGLVLVAAAGADTLSRRRSTAQHGG
ncbi:sugar ABC transporter permease [Saccharopolyspora phatthalungensis]|uniref:Xylose transport system permease protein XylH n=1 Tax=Saccharopolyspora phatthalungensis TaxID=664693 RepID=A0A840QDZ4_9PSEU|nr:ABC transporter permease [Saccharopolyspora phatthalungensis]MBB5158050.1 D-xylose transport system permease protein [Saccharopolyspora phatthalungensis]